MTHKLHIENVTKVEVVGDKTTVYVKQGSNVYIDFASAESYTESNEVEEVEVDEVVEEPVKEKPKTKRKSTKSTPKKVKVEEPEEVEEVVEEEVVVEEEIEEIEDEYEDEEDSAPFDVEEEGFTELEEEDIQSVNDVFAASTDTANNAVQQDIKPVVKEKSNLFASGSGNSKDENTSKKSAFDF